MSHQTTRYTILAASVAAALAAPTGAVLAQSAHPTASAELAEIVVTARQREEKITDVPVSVQAFTSEDIKAAGIERPADFVGLTAGVSMVQTAEVGDIQINIRGINTGRDAETNYAFVVDGVLQTNPSALNQELSGVSQIEILKGPQGALYGRNAVAGAVAIEVGEHLQGLRLGLQDCSQRIYARGGARTRPRDRRGPDDLGDLSRGGRG
jgi:iron complex outermembrane receptor protein